MAGHRPEMQKSAPRVGQRSRQTHREKLQEHLVQREPKRWNVHPVPRFGQALRQTHPAVFPLGLPRFPEPQARLDWEPPRTDFR